MPATRRISSPLGVLSSLALAFTFVVARPAAAQVAPAQAPAAPPEASVFPLTTLWSVKLDTAPALFPAYDEARAYLVLRPDPERGISTPRLTAVSLSDGSTRWTREIDSADAIAIGGDRVLLCAGPLLQAFATSDGAPAWRLPLGAPLSAPLLSARGWLIAATQASDVVAVRAADGARLWQAHLPSPATGRPAVAGDALYLPLTDNRVLRLKLDTGAVSWDEKILSQPTTLLALDDRVFVGTREYWFYALQPADGKVVWRSRIGGAVVGEPEADASRVYLLTLDNLIRALDRQSGHLKWRQMLVHRERFGPLRIDDLLFVSGPSQTIQAYDANTGKAAGSFDAPHDRLSPVHEVPGLLAHDFLLIAVTGEGELMAIRPKTLQPEAFALSPLLYLTTGFPIWR